METPDIATPIHARIVEGLERIATALKSDDWSRAQAAGVNPTQLSILRTLEGRNAGLSVKDLSFQLGVSQPTVTDSILALERKSLVEKRPDPADGRAVRVVITDTGRAAVQAGDAATGTVGQAAAALDDEDQELLLVQLVSLIRQLQEQGAIPIQRMCVSCRYFRPYAHDDAARPHHCNFVDAAFGQQDLRIDCRDHETADPSVRAATWATFQKGRPLHPPGN
ncbi:MarR family transcriptional regulator [Aquamicrobium sp.]|uniref:MarR family winged helix-turn-helix transcriptional regulator n=1 Tax=Aquamicrobium sp. TaxID=1872579 RepID=UPI002590A9B1|nr:MarR family transcriptional regulator [Aquamicrobium sp.]MCK9554053.1 MarR family transcriptional regulator [Aquamicrobium sp.]